MPRVLEDGVDAQPSFESMIDAKIPEDDGPAEEAVEGAEEAEGAEEVEGAPAKDSTEEQGEEGGETQEATEDAEAKEEESAPATFVIPEELKPFAGEAKSFSDVATQFKAVQDELKGEQDANAEMVEILESHGALIPILRDLKKGKPLYEAVRKHLKIEEAEIPNPDTDPEKYDKYVRDQVRLEMEMKEDQKKQAEREKVMESARNHAATMRTSFQEKNKVSADEMSKFQGWLKEMVAGNPKTGQLPQDFYERMWKAYTYEAKVTEAEKKGKVDGRNEVIDATKNHAKKVGDGLPNLRSGGAKIASGDKELDTMLESFKPKSRLTETPL